MKFLCKTLRQTWSRNMATFILEIGIRLYRLASNSYHITTEGIAHNIYQIGGSVRPRADTDN